jgi:tRNA pseudouridine32 synthase/23S rRNA pseudouridine746 synthase
MGWPIVGDAIYGTAPRPGTRVAASAPALQLHAREIVVPLYRKREPIRVSAPVPAHMVERLKACGWAGEIAAPIMSPASSQ